MMRILNSPLNLIEKRKKNTRTFWRNLKALSRGRCAVRDSFSSNCFYLTRRITTACSGLAESAPFKFNRLCSPLMPSVMPPGRSAATAREASRRFSEAVITTDCRPTRRQRGPHHQACAGGSRLNRGVRRASIEREERSAHVAEGQGRGARAVTSTGGL